MPLLHRPPDRKLQAEVVQRMQALQREGIDQPDLSAARKSLFLLTFADDKLRESTETELDDNDNLYSGERDRLIFDTEEKMFKESKKDSGLDDATAKGALLEHVIGRMAGIARDLSIKERGPGQALLFGLKSSPAGRQLGSRIGLGGNLSEALGRFRHGHAEILSPDLRRDALRDAAGRFATALPTLDPASVTKALLGDGQGISAALRHEVDVVGYATKLLQPGPFAFKPRMDGGPGSTNIHTFLDAARHLMHGKMQRLLARGRASPDDIAREASSITDALRNKGLNIPLSSKDLERAGLSALLLAGRLSTGVMERYDAEDLRKALDEAVRQELFLNANGSRYSRSDDVRTDRFRSFIAGAVDAMPEDLRADVYASLSVAPGQDRRERLADELLTHAQQTWQRLRDPARSGYMG